MEMYRCPLDPVSMVAASRWGLHLFFFIFNNFITLASIHWRRREGGRMWGNKKCWMKRPCSLGWAYLLSFFFSY